MANNSMITRSFRVGGEKTTTVALEPEYWDMLDAILISDGITLGKFCRALKAQQANGALSSRIRIYITKYYYDAAQKSSTNLSGKRPSEVNDSKLDVAIQSGQIARSGWPPPLGTQYHGIDIQYKPMG